MKKAYLYCDKRSLNDATVYYVNIVNDSLRARGYSVDIVYHLKDMSSRPDLIFTITSLYFVKAKLKFPFAKTVNWVQGLGLEEAKMTRPMWKWLPYWILEQVKILMSDMLLFVSDKMYDYYNKYFAYRASDYVIMPCYNLHLDTSFDESKYSSPSFVYAGSVDKWQRIDILLDVYAYVERKIPSATLTMYSKESDYIYNEAQKRGIQNISVKYVSLERLQEELKQYKYGFILREKNWVNYVATPTKMNSYLAAYIIPVFSDGVNDFERNIQLGEFTIMARTPLDVEKIAEQILNFEKKEIDYTNYASFVQDIFDNHYNDDYYKRLIVDKMQKLGI